MDFSRRIFLKSSLTGATVLALPTINIVNAKNNHQSYLKIAAKAKKSWSGTQLKVLYPKGSLGNLKPVVAEFYKLTNIKVILKEASLDNISAEMMLDKKVYSETSFDIGLPATFNIPDLVEAGVIEDLSSLAKEHEPRAFKSDFLYDRGDYYKNKFYGYQTDGDTYLMFLNKSFLENKRNQKEYQSLTGKELTIPQTWEELDRQIRFFHRPENKQFGGNLYRNKEYQIWEYWIRLHGKKLLPFDKEMNPLINHPDAVKALEEMISINNYLDPRAMNDGLFDNFKHFAEGRSYVNLGWGGTQKYLNGPKSKVKDQLIYAQPPGGLSNGKAFNVPFFNWGWNYTVSKNSKQKELAYLFCLFATSSTISKRAVHERSGYFDPFRQSHYRDKQIIDTYGEGFLKTHEVSLKNSIPDLYLSGQTQYLGSLKQVIYNCSLGNLKPQMALNDLSKKWQEITNKEERSKQIEQWGYLKQRYPENLKKVLKI